MIIETNGKILNAQVLKNKRIPIDYHEAVKLITQPYIPISKEVYDDIVEYTLYHNSDVLLIDDKQYTFGNTRTNDFALMPLIDTTYF